MRVLVVEDDRDLNRQLVTALTDAGYAVDAAFDGEDGFFLGETEPYDVVILEANLPRGDGLTLLRRWRSAGVNTHVLLVSTRPALGDQVAGLDAGADDYLTKPFELDVLFARMRASSSSMWKGLAM